MLDRASISTNNVTRHRYRHAGPFTIQGWISGEFYDTKYSFHSIDQCLDKIESLIEERDNRELLNEKHFRIATTLRV